VDGDGVEPPLFDFLLDVAVALGQLFLGRVNVLLDCVAHGLSFDKDYYYILLVVEQTPSPFH